ncbi:MAG: fadL [Rhodocyclales bacterium]|nr:fadL [Rhodocyclales bacterium]
MMKHRKQQKVIVQSVVAALAVLGAGAASAAGFQLLEQNASGLGNAYAGSAAVSENASTIYFNPAGMTQLKGLQVSGGATVVKATYEFHDNGSSSGAFTGTGNGTNGGTLGRVPNLYMSSELGGNFYAGIGFGAPFGLRTQYEVPWAGAAQATLFDIKTINVNPSLAYKINDKFSVGVGLDYQKMEVQYQRMASTLAVFSLSSDAVALKANDDAWGWNVGFLFTPSDSMKLGFSYRSRMKYDLQGDLKASGPTAALLAANTGNASAQITLPDTFIFSVAQKLGDKWEMLGDISRTRWSSVQDVDIKLTASGATAQTLLAHFRDTWRVALGSNYKLSDAWKLKAGVGYDQGVAKGADYRLVSLPDNDRMWLSLGTQWAVSKALALDVGASYIKVRDAQIYNDQRAANRGLVNGSYAGHIWLLGAQASYAF